MRATLNLGLIGYGFAGATFHAPAIVHSGRCQLAAIATSQAAQAGNAYPQARIVADIDAVLACDDIAGVVIATPNTTHFELARRALQAGKHVVVDKPVTLDAADAHTLAQLAAQRGLLLAPFHNRRWDGDFLGLRALLAAGRLGRVTHYESHFDRFRPRVPQRWREQAEHGGGLLFDLGPHLIDQALALFGRPQTVTATLRQLRDGAEVPDYVHIQLSYPNQEVVLHASALTAWVAPRFTVHGTAGSFISQALDVQEEQLKAGLRPGQPGYGKNPPGLLREGDAQHVSDAAWPLPDGDYPGFYRALAESLLDGKAFPVAAQDAVDVMQIIALAQRSQDEQRTLPFVALC